MCTRGMNEIGRRKRQKGKRNEIMLMDHKSFVTVTIQVLTLIRLLSCFLLQLSLSSLSPLLPPLHGSPLLLDLVIQLQIPLKKKNTNHLTTILKFNNMERKLCYNPTTATLLTFDQSPTSWLPFLSAFSAWYLSSSSSRSAFSLSASSSRSLSWALQLASPSSTHTKMGTSVATTPSPWVSITVCDSAKQPSEKANVHKHIKTLISFRKTFS